MANDDLYTSLTLHTDGGSRNNPGHAGIGFVISGKDGNFVAEEKKYIGIATNNEAEYQALLLGLRHIRNFYTSCSTITVYADSELMIKQLRGEYKIRESHLKKYADEIKTILSQFSVYKLVHVKRAENKEADRLVNEALDEHLDKLR